MSQHLDKKQYFYCLSNGNTDKFENQRLNKFVNVFPDLLTTTNLFYEIAFEALYFDDRFLSPYIPPESSQPTFILTPIEPNVNEEMTKKSKDLIRPSEKMYMIHANMSVKELLLCLNVAQAANIFQPTRLEDEHRHWLWAVDNITKQIHFGCFKSQKGWNPKKLSPPMFLYIFENLARKICNTDRGVLTRIDGISYMVLSQLDDGTFCPVFTDLNLNTYFEPHVFINVANLNAVRVNDFMAPMIANVSLDRNKHKDITNQYNISVYR